MTCHCPPKQPPPTTTNRHHLLKCHKDSVVHKTEFNSFNSVVGLSLELFFARKCRGEEGDDPREGEREAGSDKKSPLYEPTYLRSSPPLHLFFSLIRWFHPASHPSIHPSLSQKSKTKKENAQLLCHLYFNRSRCQDRCDNRRGSSTSTATRTRRCRRRCCCCCQK